MWEGNLEGRSGMLNAMIVKGAAGVERTGVGERD